MENVVIHVRFNIDGTVNKIGECPTSATAQQWFNHLSRSTVDCYSSLSGGRGLFNIEKGTLDTLKQGLPS